MTQPETKADEAVVLTKEQAREMLPTGNRVHTFRQSIIGALIGADWSRADVLEAIEKFEFELSGEQATRINHGMVFRDSIGYVFVETKKANAHAA